MGEMFLTYCMNVHPGESAADVFSAVRKYAAPVSQARGADKFGIGLRLAKTAACEFAASADLRQSFLQLMRENRLFAFTVNAFPYGAFHGAVIKDSVYRPAWNNPARLEYVKNASSVLASFLPEYVKYGSVSTSPPWFKKWGTMPSECLDGYVAAAGFLRLLEARTGKKIVLCIEPEPGCFPETCAEIINLFSKLRAAGLDDNLSGYLGVCLDAAHQAVEFEDFSDTVQKVAAAGIFIGKIHISAALEIPADGEGREILEKFNEPWYLHQTTHLSPGGVLTRVLDIPEIRSAVIPHGGVFRSHFHVPLTSQPPAPARSTAYLLRDGAFAAAAAAAGCEHFECETYTWNIWPDFDGRPENLVKGIASELDWASAALTNGVFHTGRRR